MSTKLNAIYACLNCGAQFPKWSGRCMSCGKWGSLSEEIQETTDKHKRLAGIPPAETISFDRLATIKMDRIKTGISEIDRVLGGGIVSGSLILLAGEPGIGKSTIVMQIAKGLSDKPVMLVSGEESAHQAKDRLERLGCSGANLKFVSETNGERILAAVADVKPALVIVDSIQTVTTMAVEAEAGSISQIRGCTALFLETAKKENITFILIGHVTKDGLAAGPKTMEHMVDTVLYLEVEPRRDYRILRATKNRFGAVNEVGIFAMTGHGLEEIKNPAGIFLEGEDTDISGSVVSAVMEGSRPFLLEVQALVTKTLFGYPQRKAGGLDLNRLQILTAVMTKRTGINLSNQDVIINIAGGLKANDPALDLAVCLAIAASLLNQTIDHHTIVLGEVGLGGEIRRVTRTAERLREAAKLGFTNAVLPAGDYPDHGLKMIMIKKLDGIMKNVLTV